MEQSKWKPDKIINLAESGIPFACIVLNRPINFEPDDFRKLWNKAEIRVLVDGGANQWFKYLDKHNLIGQVEPPNFTTGDMDSITDESCRRLDELECQRILTPDQDDTDCTKAIITIMPSLISNKIMDVLLITDFGGRIDQTMSQINTLYKTFSADVRIYLRNYDSLAWLLNSGRHEIEIPQYFVDNGLWCAYLPMNGSTCVTTTGLKWDLTSTTVEFGGIVSTSNTYKDTKVVIESDNYLLWSMGTKKESSD